MDPHEVSFNGDQVIAYGNTEHPRTIFRNRSSYVVAVSCSGGYAYLITSTRTLFNLKNIDDGKVYSYDVKGTTDYDQMGVSTTKDKYTTNLVEGLEGQVVVSAHSSTNQTIFYTKEQTLFGLGNNHYYQMDETLPTVLRTATQLPLTGIGSNTVTHYACAFSFSLVVTESKYIHIIGQDWITTNGEKHGLTLETQDPIASISAGSFHAVILTTTGKAFSGGENNPKINRGSIKMGNRDFGPMVDLQDKKVIELRARNDYSIGITADGDVWVFGSSFEKSGLVGRFSNFLSASCGTKHMAIMTKSGELFMMGTNDKKELPIDEAMYRHDFIKSNITSGKAIRAGCGDSFTIVYFAEHTSDRQRQKMHALIDKEQLCDVTIRVHSLY